MYDAICCLVFHDIYQVLEVMGVEEEDLPYHVKSIRKLNSKEDLQIISHKVVFTRCVTHCFMSSVSFRRQMGSSTCAILLLFSPQRLYARGLTLIGVLLTLAG